MPVQTRKVDTNNLLNFQAIIDALKGFGNAYRPPVETLYIQQLEDLLAGAKAVVEKAREKKAYYQDKLKEHKIAFDNLKVVSKGIVFHMEFGNTCAYRLQRVKDVERKMQGKLSLAAIKAHKKKNPDDVKGLYAKKHKVDYILQMQYFMNFISILQIEPEYKPNQEELEVENLKRFHDQLFELNNEVLVSHQLSKNAHRKLTEVLYKDNNSIYNTATRIKNYIKGALGATSEEFKKIKGIRFSKPAN